MKRGTCLMRWKVVSLAQEKLTVGAVSERAPFRAYREESPLLIACLMELESSCVKLWLDFMTRNKKTSSS
jgi:hypothetical protein